jgi:hypothetical protein
MVKPNLKIQPDNSLNNNVVLLTMQRKCFAFVSGTPRQIKTGGAVSQKP